MKILSVMEVALRYKLLKLRTLPTLLTVSTLLTLLALLKLLPPVTLLTLFKQLLSKKTIMIIYDTYNYIAKCWNGCRSEVE